MQKTDRWIEFLAGIRYELPILLGVVPFGMIYGAFCVQAGLPIAVAQGMSVVVFAGSAQFVTATLFSQATPALVVLTTAVILNLRHMFYSASVAPYTRRLPTPWKLLLAYLLTDEAYAVTIVHYQEEGRQENRHWFFFGAGIILWLGWQASTALGIFLGLAVPPGLSLDFALALTFIALLIPVVKDRPTLAAAAAAGVAALLLAGLPYKLGFMVAAAVGILAGMALEGRK